jgi:hypothetical protein
VPHGGEIRVKLTSKCCQTQVFEPKPAHSAHNRTIADNPLFLIGELLGFEMLNSGNYWVLYREKRNHLLEHFAHFVTF